MTGIRRTYNDGNIDDRAWIDDYWSWLREQPQDAWLLWARGANWDNADAIFAEMLDDPGCDLALVAFIFWGADPAFRVRNPGHFTQGDLVHTIVGNVERGFYSRSDLYLDRYSVIHNAHDYLKALGEVGTHATPPFRLPRVLCGPFEGRRPASLPTRYDARTEQDLAEMFDKIDGGLPRSEREYQEAEERGGNLWIKPHLRLPTIPPDPVAAFAALDDTAFLAAIFGTSANYDEARAAATRPAPRKGWWPFS